MSVLGGEEMLWASLSFSVKWRDNSTFVMGTSYGVRIYDWHIACAQLAGDFGRHSNISKSRPGGPLCVNASSRARGHSFHSESRHVSCV